MALIGTLFFIFTAACVGAKSVAVTLECSAESVGKHGQQSLLQCVVKPTAEGLEITAVTWRKDGVKNALLLFHNEPRKSEDGYKFAEPFWTKKNMNVSLLITNTMVAHAGVYTCMVVTSSGDATETASLKVTAKYSQPIIRSVPEMITENTDGVLICDSDGGYPKGDIHWIVGHDTEWPNSSEMKAEQGPSGLFHLSSMLTLLRGSTFSKYTCVVVNASGGREERAVYELEGNRDQAVQGGGEKSDSTSKIVAPVLVIGSLIVGLLLVLLYLRRRQNGPSYSSEEAGLSANDQSNQM